LLSRSSFSHFSSAVIQFYSSIDLSHLWWYNSGMKVKTSVTLSKDIISLIDQHAEGENNRSAFIELAVRSYLENLKRQKRDSTDLKILNRLSEKLNKEAEEVLGYQVEIHG
jgi:metal-responsive CopG/Arc/MetJ family transcriptional regulator